MANRETVLKGATDISLWNRVLDNSTGEPKTANAAIAGTIWFQRRGESLTEASAGSVTGVATVHKDNAIIHVKGGYHRMDYPDTAFASAAAVDQVICGFSALSCVTIATIVDLVQHDPVAAIEDISANLAALTTQVTDMSASLEDRITTLSASMDDRIATLSAGLADNILALSATMEAEFEGLSAGVSARVQALSASMDDRIATMSAGLADNVLALSATMEAEFEAQSATIALHGGGGSTDVTGIWKVNITSGEFSANSMAARMATISANANTLLSLSGNLVSEFDAISAAVTNSEHNLSAVMTTEIDGLSATLDDEARALSAAITTEGAAVSAGVSDLLHAYSATHNARIATLSGGVSTNITAAKDSLSATVDDEFRALSGVAQNAVDAVGDMSASIDDSLVALSANLATNIADASTAAYAGYYQSADAVLQIVMEDESGSPVGGIKVVGTRSLNGSSASAVVGNIAQIGGMQAYAFSATGADFGARSVLFKFSSTAAQTVYYGPIRCTPTS